jgi:hypothetical protein
MLDKYIFLIIISVSSITSFLLIRMWIKDEDNIFEENNDDD